MLSIGGQEWRDFLDIVANRALSFRVRWHRRYLHSMVKREFPWLLGEDTVEDFFSNWPS